jgi:serine/threonine protein kinase
MTITDEGGLSAAHAAGFVHRNLKPANILGGRDGRLKILGFGLAKNVAPPRETGATRAINSTDPGTILGTAAYMSPEQARGESVDARSDQFSFGLVLYQIASGTVVWAEFESV